MATGKSRSAEEKTATVLEMTKGGDSIGANRSIESGQRKQPTPRRGGNKKGK
jgi:hypothetical protein